MVLMIFMGYMKWLHVRSAFQSQRCSYSAAQLEERIDTMALIRNEFPRVVQKIIDNKGGVSPGGMLGNF